MMVMEPKRRLGKLLSNVLIELDQTGLRLDVPAITALAIPSSLKAEGSWPEIAKFQGD